MKRLFLALAVLAALAAAYVYVITKRENSHRELIRQGDAAMAAGDLSTAIEAFSGAITLKGDAMIGYLMRGDAYRRRDELEAALRDLRQAADLDPTAPKPRELLGDTPQAIVDLMMARTLSLRDEFDDGVCGELVRGTMGAELFTDAAGRARVVFHAWQGDEVGYPEHRYLHLGTLTTDGGIGIRLD